MENGPEEGQREQRPGRRLLHQSTCGVSGAGPGQWQDMYGRDGVEGHLNTE